MEIVLIISLIIQGHGVTEVHRFNSLEDCKRIQFVSEVKLLKAGLKILDSYCIKQNPSVSPGIKQDRQPIETKPKPIEAKPIPQDKIPEIVHPPEFLPEVQPLPTKPKVIKKPVTKKAKKVAATETKKKKCRKKFRVVNNKRRLYTICA